MSDPFTATVAVISEFVESSEVAAAISETTELTVDSVNLIAESSGEFGILSSEEIIEIKQSTKEINLRSSLVGEVGEKVSKIEDLNRGILDYRDQVPYSDISKKTTKIMDAQYTRPVGATYSEICIDSNGTPYLRESIALEKQSIAKEIKNFSQASMNIENNKIYYDSHLMEQLKAMTELNESAPIKPFDRIELSLPRDIALDPVNAEFIARVNNIGVRVTTHMGIESQEKLGLI